MPHRLTPEQEQHLLLQARDDPDGMRDLYRHYVASVYAYIFSRVGQRHDTEDLVSETFLKVVEHFDTFQWKGNQAFHAWLFCIAHNVVQDFHRQAHQQRNLVQFDALQAVQAEELLPDEIALQKEQFDHLYSLLTTLSLRRQDVITLKFFGGLRNKEIAAILDLDEHTIAAHLSRGLRELHQTYTNEDEDDHEQTPRTKSPWRAGSSTA